MSALPLVDVRRSRQEFESLDDATHWLQLHNMRWAYVYVDGYRWLLGCDGSAELDPAEGQVRRG